MTTLEPPPIPPGFTRRWCDTLSEGSESPPGAFLTSGLAVLSATVGPRLRMQWSVTHWERLNLWLLNVGMSALDRKTSGLSGLHQAIKWIREGGDDLVRAFPVHRISDAGIVTQLDVVTRDTAKAREQDPDTDEVHRPVPVSWVATFNEVASIWKDDPRGWENEAQRSLLSIYDGQLSSTTKATAVPTQECFVTAIGNIPPGVLRDQTTLGMLSSGFVGRWLVIPSPPPERHVSFYLPNGHDPTTVLRADLMRLMLLARKQDGALPVNMMWEKDALLYRHDWYVRHRERIRRDDPDDAILRAQSELIGRLQATAVKVATLVAVGRSLGDVTRLEEVRVTVADCEWAQTVCDRSVQYVTHVLSDNGGQSRTPAGRVESRIIRHLEKKKADAPGASVTVTALADMAKGGDVSRQDISRALSVLEDMGVVAVEKDGRSRRVWLLQEAAA